MNLFTVGLIIAGTIALAVAAWYIRKAIYRKLLPPENLGEEPLLGNSDPTLPGEKTGSTLRIPLFARHKVRQAAETPPQQVQPVKRKARTVQFAAAAPVVRRATQKAAKEPPLPPTRDEQVEEEEEEVAQEMIIDDDNFEPL
jgi:hypothetical protein